MKRQLNLFQISGGMKMNSFHSHPISLFVLEIFKYILLACMTAELFYLSKSSEYLETVLWTHLTLWTLQEFLKVNIPSRKRCCHGNVLVTRLLSFVKQKIVALGLLMFIFYIWLECILLTEFHMRKYTKNTISFFLVKANV